MSVGVNALNKTQVILGELMLLSTLSLLIS